jgi:hypothetical protein
MNHFIAISSDSDELAMLLAIIKGTINISISSNIPGSRTVDCGVS